MAGETLDHIKSRALVRCGVSEGIAGFSMKDAAGQWSGLDVDFCRAVAAAALGSADRVAFVSLTAPARFPALQAHAIDVLVRNTTWTLSREAGLHTQFAGTLYYDEQKVLVPSTSGGTSLAQLRGATVCVVRDTTHEQNLLEYFTTRGLTLVPLFVDSIVAGGRALLAGRCDGYTAEAALLAGMNLGASRDHRFVI